MDTANPRFEELKKLMEEKDSLVKEGKYLEAEEIRRKILSIKTAFNKDRFLFPEKRFIAFITSQTKTDIRRRI